MDDCSGGSPVQNRQPLPAAREGSDTDFAFDRFAAF
jgi:hypothetical protein